MRANRSARSGQHPIAFERAASLAPSLPGAIPRARFHVGAALAFADGTVLTGRLGATADGAVDVVIRAGSGWKVRRVELADIRKAVVQVEFSPPNAKELDLVGGTGKGADT